VKNEKKTVVVWGRREIAFLDVRTRISFSAHVASRCQPYAPLWLLHFTMDGIWKENVHGTLGYGWHYALSLADCMWVMYTWLRHISKINGKRVGITES
jgi:hypothetical protein